MTLIFLLSSCTPAPTVVPTAISAPVWIRLSYSPSLDSLRGDFETCLPPEVGLAIQDMDGWAFPAAEADIRLIWAAPEKVEGFAVELGSEELVVVVHPQNDILAFDLEDLRLVYSGELADWDFLGRQVQPLQAYAIPAENDAWQLFNEVVLGAKVPLGREIIVPPSPEELLAAVAADPGALGILPRRYVDASVRAVPISDLVGDALVRPILALSPVEPQGAVRAWVACMQEQVK